jgi:Mn-dependent DtxR family transcriptional regulator
MALHSSGEMYLETIRILEGKLDGIHALDISKHMGYSKPSVSRALKRLTLDGYVKIDETDHVTLTLAGREIAEKIYERHTILTGMLRALGVDEKTAAEDACEIEHVISDETFEAIKRHMREKG